MEEYPPGGWFIGELQDFADWARDLRALPKSKKLHSAVMLLRQFSVRVHELIDPPPDDDEGPNEYPAQTSIPAPPPPAMSTSFPAGPSRPRPTTRGGGSRLPASEVPDYEPVTVDPSVIHVQHRPQEEPLPSAVVESPVQCTKCITFGRVCMVPKDSPEGTRCVNCDEKHYGCSLFTRKPPVGRKKQGKKAAPPTTSPDDAGPSTRGKAKSSTSLEGPPSPVSSKSPNKAGLLQKLVKPFTRRSSDMQPEAPPDDDASFEPVPPPIPPPISRPRRAGPSHTMEVYIPRNQPNPTMSPSPFDASSFRHDSPYSMAAPGPSSASLLSVSGASYTSSLEPGDPGYAFELQRLRIEFNASQERLRTAEHLAAQQQALWQQERIATENRHQEELAEARRRGGSSSKSEGKRRKQ